MDVLKTLEQYTKFVTTMASQKTKEGQTSQGIIGISSEAGEMIDALKKHMFQGRDLDATNLKEECGDVFFYLTELMAALDTDLLEIINTNVKKLEARYPGGKFDKEMSLLRDLKNERKILDAQEKKRCGHCDRYGGDLCESADFVEILTEAPEDCFYQKPLDY